MFKYENITVKLKIVILALAVSLLIHCGSVQESKVIDRGEILDNVFTFELSFGADELTLPDEYLLAWPYLYVAVAENGDIIVSDENYLKVYDSNGNPKKIFGGLGEGPGEFSLSPIPTITETGYFAISDYRESLSFFTPDYKFLEKVNLKSGMLNKNILEKTGFASLDYNNVYAYSPDEILIWTITYGKILNKIIYEREKGCAIIYQNGDQVTTIARSEYVPYWLITGIDIISPYLQMSVIPERKIVYSNQFLDRTFEDNTWFYSLFIYDLQTKEQKEIKRAYSPVAIPDSVINPPEYHGQKIRDEEKLLRKKLKELEFYPPLERILTDRNFIFVYTYEFAKNKGRIVDVFDAKEGVYLRSVYFPFFPRPIKNGYAYNKGLNDEGFFVVEKYKVNPAVYSK